MKNRILFLLLGLSLAAGVRAQPTGRLGTHDAVTQWNPSASVTPFSSLAQGNSIAQQIIDVVGLKPNFELREANVPNAAAVVYGGKRYVLYNPNFIQQLAQTTGTQWAGISVLAHEIGHHLNGHTLTGGGSQPQLELESDEFSGFVLRKMGATLVEAQAAMKTLATVNASRTHPGQYDRLTAIADGWNKADAQVTGKKYVAAAKPQVQPPQAAQNTVVATARPAVSTRIIGDVHFDADAASAYYVTSQYQLVRVKGDQLNVIGKLAALNSSRFPYMIYDETNTQLFVDAYGTIVTRNGRSVGQLSARTM